MTTPESFIDGFEPPIVSPELQKAMDDPCGTLATIKNGDKPTEKKRALESALTSLLMDPNCFRGHENASEVSQMVATQFSDIVLFHIDYLRSKEMEPNGMNMLKIAREQNLEYAFSSVNLISDKHWLGIWCHELFQLALRDNPNVALKFAQEYQEEPWASTWIMDVIVETRTAVRAHWDTRLDN